MFRKSSKLNVKTLVTARFRRQVCLFFINSITMYEVPVRFLSTTDSLYAISPTPVQDFLCLFKYVGIHSKAFKKKKKNRML